MSIEESHQGALVCKVDVEVLWEPGNFQDDGAKSGSVPCEQHRPGAVDGEVEQGVIDNMIVFQKPFLGAARTELESQLQRAVKVSAKGKHVKCKMDLERCLFWDTAGNRVPRPAEFAPAGARACGGPARVANGQAVGRALLRRRAARSRPPPAARSLWPVRRPRTGAQREVAELLIGSSTPFHLRCFGRSASMRGALLLATASSLPRGRPASVRVAQRSVKRFGSRCVSRQSVFTCAR